MSENGASDASSIDYDEQSDENVHEESCEEYSEEIVSQQSLDEENDLSEQTEGEQDKEGTQGLSEESDNEPSEDSDYEPSEDIVYKPEQPAKVPCEEEEIDPIEETFLDSPHSDSSYEKKTFSFKETNRKPCQEPLDASRLPTDSDNNDFENQLQSVSTYSNEKKRSLDAKDGDHHLTKKCKASQSLGIQSDVGSASTPQKRPESVKSCSDAANASAQQGHSGSSEKRRRSRWDPQPECNKEEGESDRTCKRRKSRWAADDSHLKNLGPIQLQNAEVRNVGFHGKLVRDRQEIIAKLIEKKSTFRPPLDYKPPKLFKKLYIPVTEYPCYNFIGLIIGPRGLTQKRMEKETGAKILLRGKGSARDRQPPQKHDPSDNEDLHVLIEAENQKSLDDAVGMVEKLLIPVDEGMNDHKRAQLREVAALNGKLRHDNVCHTCGEEGHMNYACPGRSSTLTSGFSCETCGGSSHSTAACPLTVSTPDSSFCNQLKGSFSGDVGRTGGFTFSTPQISSCIPWQGGNTESDISPSSYGSNSHSAPGSTPLTDGKSCKEVDDANLLVRYLPQTVDDNRIRELFSPFGRLIEAKVIKDRSMGCSKGYGFVRYAVPSNATTAVACMNGYKIDGKSLAVMVAGKPFTPGPPCTSYLPPYPGPAMVSQDSPSPASWPGPPGSMLPDSFSSTKSNTFGLLPFVFLGHSDSSSERSSPPHHVPIASSVSLVQFPGNPDYTGSQYTSFLTPSSNISPQLHTLSNGVLPFSWTATHPPGNGTFHSS